MGGLPLTLTAGLMVGFASSLHCAGMCGAIGSALMLAAHPQGALSTRARTLLLSQAGRILAYAAAGGVVGLFGTRFVGLFDSQAAFHVMRSASAAALIWIGLSTAGLVPSMARLDRVAALAGGTMMRLAGQVPGFATGAPLAAGIAWGFMPCAMVYGALFAAMLQTSAAGGATFMLGFGLGTLPSVIAAALGLAQFRNLSRWPKLRPAVGLAIACLGALSLSFSPLAAVLCLGT